MPDVPPRPRLLIEDWLPIAFLGFESIRERTPMTPFPAPNRLHVWWARRPLIASRAAILASLLPSTADRKKFTHLLGIHGDPVKARSAIDNARRTGIRVDNPYGYDRAFSYSPTINEFKWFNTSRSTITPGEFSVLDPTAGGGSIPFEALRLGARTLANDLNPVAWLILKATVEFPSLYGKPLLTKYDQLSKLWRSRMESQLISYFPINSDEDCEDTTYLWSRTIHCPYCGGLILLSPNWRLDSAGTGVKIHPRTADSQKRHCTFEIVTTTKAQSPGTVKAGNAICPFPDCSRIIDGDEIKEQAQAGMMGHQLYAVVFKKTVKTGSTKAGKDKFKTERGFRAPRLEDDVNELVEKTLAAKMPGWKAGNVVPDEPYPEGTNDDRPRQYGMPLWRDMFSPRQLLGHCTSVEVLHELVDELREQHGGEIPEIDKAAMVYIAFAMDKMLNYNSRMSVWMLGRTHQISRIMPRRPVR